ncbi:MAG: AI-2E family transporter, partial [Lachnospiraceae bacterium]|nr:AI-2E family transporter [Lachnospiraceae bacterium]
IPAIQESLQNLNIDWESTIRKALEVVAVGAGGLFSSVVTVIGSLFGTMAQFIIGTIFAIYILSSKETLAEKTDNLMKAYMKPTTREKILYVAGTVHETFSAFIVGQCMEAVIIGSLCAVGMMVLKMPYAVMTGTVVGVTALIPVVGAYIGAIIGAFMVFTVNPMQAVIFIVFLLILQQLEGNLIYPKVVGSSIGLPGMWVLAAVTIGGGVFGIGGMLLGVPLTASLYKLLEADVEKRIKTKK